MRHESIANVHVETRLLRHDAVIPSLPEAAEAGSTPDLHFLWNGIYHIEHAWNGLLHPLEQFFGHRELAVIGGGTQSRFRGQTYRAAWYLIPVVWVANIERLNEVGIDVLPETWDELAEMCAQLTASNVAPIVAGDAEGDLSVWWLTHLLTQALDTEAQVSSLALGRNSWHDNNYGAAWNELHRFVEHGWIDRSSLDLTLWEAFKRFSRGQGAFTLASGPMFVECRRLLGTRVRMMTCPRLFQGKLSSRPIIDTQGLGIPARAPSPEAGAELLRTLLGRETADELNTSVGLLPARADWTPDPDQVDPDLRWAHDHYLDGTSAPYVPNLLPLELHFDVCAAIGRDVIAGRLDPITARSEADARCLAWRLSDPHRLHFYREWVEDVHSVQGGCSE